jgi:hypothetical protein
MLNYRQYGHEDMKNYIDCYLLRAKDMTAKQPCLVLAFITISWDSSPATE